MAMQVNIKYKLANSVSVSMPLIITVALSCFFQLKSVVADSVYVRNSANNNHVIVFVHGIMGNSDTWRSTSAYWPELLTTDKHFDDANIFVYEYPTSLTKGFSIDELAENMRLILDSQGINEHENVSYLVHSMGGLVLRSYLLKYRTAAEKVRMAYFFSTPTEGSQISSLASLISKNPQLGKMIPIQSESFLADLIRGWRSAKLSLASYCAYEKRDTYGVKIVTFESAAALCSEALDPIDANHIDIVKPKDKQSISYIAFKSAYQKHLNEPQNDHTKELLGYYQERASLVYHDFVIYEKYISEEGSEKTRNLLRLKMLRKKKEFDQLHTLHLEAIRKNEQKMAAILSTQINKLLSRSNPSWGSYAYMYEPGDLSPFYSDYYPSSGENLMVVDHISELRSMLSDSNLSQIAASTILDGCNLAIPCQVALSEILIAPGTNKHIWNQVVTRVCGEKELSISSSPIVYRILNNSNQYYDRGQWNAVLEIISCLTSKDKNVLMILIEMLEDTELGARENDYIYKHQNVKIYDNLDIHIEVIEALSSMGALALTAVPAIRQTVNYYESVPSYAQELINVSKRAISVIEAGSK